MSFKFGGSGGGGGAGDTYTASTAVAGIPVENGRTYNLSNEGKLSPSTLKLVEQTSFPVPNSVTGASGYAHAPLTYGDMITPDGKATFHLITDNASGYYGMFYISLDGGASSNGDQTIGIMNSSNPGTPFSSQLGYHGVDKCNVFVKFLYDDDTYWYYIMWYNWQNSSAGVSSIENGGAGFMVKKADHTFNTFNSYQPKFASYSTSTSNRYDARYDYSRQSKRHFFSCRNDDIFVWTYGQYNDDLGGFSMGAVDTYTSSDSSYWGGANKGLPKTSGAQYSSTTHRDNAKEQSHMPLFKVDDANGIFIAPYYATAGSNSNEHVYIKYTIAANHTISETEIAISGTDPTQGGNGFGHWVATTNPLIFYYLYMQSSTRLYYTKCTWNSDWTSATWSTQAYVDMVGTYGDSAYGTSYWANDQDHWTMQCKLSVPEKELFFYTGRNDNTTKNAPVFKFPATGTPSFLGLTTLNNTLTGVYWQYMVMQSMNNGTMISLQKPTGKESTGYAIYYTDHFNPNFKKTSDAVAIARADAVTGATVNIDLKTGDTASTTLSSDFYLTKEGMSYPLAVEGATAAAFSTAIKSIQRGTGAFNNNTTQDITITSVDPDKTMVNFVGPGGSNSSQLIGHAGYASLVNATTLRIHAVQYSYTFYHSWEVIEYV